MGVQIVALRHSMPSHSDYVALAKSGFEQVITLLEEEAVEPTWEYVTEVDACAMYRRHATEEDNSSGIYTVRTMANFDFPAKDIFEFIWNLDNRKKFDGYLQELKVATEVPEAELSDPVKACQVLYVSFGMPFPISSRDFVHIRAWKEHNGGYFTTAKSTTHDEFPDTKTTGVRGSIDVDGFLILPNPKDATKSTVNYIARVDPKGSIPTFAVNLANRKVPQTLADIRSAMVKDRS